MMIILRSATLLAAALTLANCCMSGTVCTGPLASADVPAAAPAMAAAPTGAGPQTAIAAADLDGRLASSDTDPVMEPDISSPRKGGKRSRGDSRVDVMSSQSGSASRGRMSWEEEQAADLADEARLKQKLTICRNCNSPQ